MSDALKRRLQGGTIAPAVACVLLLGAFAPACALAQGGAPHFEWFYEEGASVLSLGRQGGVYQIPAFQIYAPFRGTIVSSNHFSYTGAFLTGVRYYLTPRDAIEASASESIENTFPIQRVGPGEGTTSTFERVPNLSLSYVRYAGSIGGWRPFLVGGVGAVWTSSLISGLDSLDGSFDFGFGADHPIANGLALRVEARDYLDRLPSPFHGYSNDISPTAGIVISSRQTSVDASSFPRIQFFLGGGASFLTGGTIPTGVGLVVPSPGTPGVIVSGVETGSYSKAGRFAMGLDIALSQRNGLELGLSYSPNRYQAQFATTQPPRITFPAPQFTQSVDDYSVDYVRHFGRVGGDHPFVLAGLGQAHFASALIWDVDRLSWNFGGGVDIPLRGPFSVRLEMQDFMEEGAPVPSQLPVQIPKPGGLINNIAPTAGLALRLW